jgi:two-component system cell cycle sensor histidine kinase/response regulator CckA
MAEGQTGAGKKRRAAVAGTGVRKRPATAGRRRPRSPQNGVLERAREALRESEERFRALAENSPDVIMRFDRQHRHLYASAVVEAQTGIPACEFLGKTHRELGFPEPLCARWEAAIDRVFAAGRPHRIEFELPSHIWIDWLLVPELDAKGAVAAVMSSARDITAHKRAEEELERRVLERTAELAAANATLQAEIRERRRVEAELRQSEQRYRALVELSPDAVVVHDGKMLLFVNPVAAEMLGVGDSRQGVGMPVVEFVHPDSRPLVAARVRQMLQEGKPAPLLEEKFQRLNGSALDVEVAAMPVMWQGTPAVQVAFRDITERKRAADALRESELQFRTLAETTGVGIFIIQDGVFKYANPAAERLTGYAAGEIAGMGFLELVHPDSRELVSERAAARLRGERDVPSRYEIKANVKDGTVRWFSLTSGVTTLGGRPALVATVTDVTEERRLREVQAALYQISEAAQTTGTLDALFASIHAAIGRLMDAKNLFIALYEPATNLISFPYFVDEVDQTPEPFPLGKGMTSYVLRSGQPLLATPEVLDELERRQEIEPLGAPSIDWLGVPLKIGEKSIGVLAVQSYAGTVRYTEADKDVLNWVSAQVAQAIERRRTGEALREAQKMQAIGQLAGGVAHDFNNLLQALLGSVELLRTKSSDGSALASGLEELEANVKRGAALTRQLLLFARREVVKLERLQLRDVVRETAILLRRLLREDIQLDLQLAAALPPVDADRGQLEQVIVNLAMNAADAMPQGGRLVIRSGRASENEVFLEVADTGSGIPEAIQTRIFEPFFTTKGAEKGIGLGLAVVHGIVAQHGGRIEVTSRIGHGSAFRVVLPRRPPSSPVALVEPLRGSDDNPVGRGERVLVVEDEVEARRVVAEILEMLGYQVTAVGSGEDAIGLASDPPFEVLLTDLLLPGVHGGELAEALRERWPRLKVIVMSGYAQDDTVRRRASLGTVRFLAKPFGMDVLAREIRAVLDE